MMKNRANSPLLRMARGASILSALGIAAGVVWWNQQRANPPEDFHSSTPASPADPISGTDLMASSKSGTIVGLPEIQNSGFGLISGSKSIQMPIFSTRKLSPKPIVVAPFIEEEPESEPPPFFLRRIAE